jgi:hypothetical protein
LIAAYDGPATLHDNAEEQYLQCAAARVAAGSAASSLRETALYHQYVAALAHGRLAELGAELEAVRTIVRQIRGEHDQLKTLRAKENEALELLRSFQTLKTGFDRTRIKLQHARTEANQDYAGEAEKDDLTSKQKLFEAARDAYLAALARAQDLLRLGGFPELLTAGVSLYIGEVNVLQLSDFAPTTPVLVKGREVSILRGQRNGTEFALKG